MREIRFAGSSAELAARFDVADDAIGTALFAHCFTCSKDIAAARRIAEGLNQRGVSVLRFDFTGLGHSDGEFGNTSFSSNIADLLAAAAWLRENAQAPKLLIGHSLGGAAVLSAAFDVPECTAVATVGAPSDPGHVTHLFGQQREEIEACGIATVTLAGRKFDIAKSFLDDLETHQLTDRLSGLNKAVLFMHAPGDTIVGIDEAAKLYTAAKHPKSFVSLDDADHLLTRPRDAQYVADVLAAWAGRYLG